MIGLIDVTVVRGGLPALDCINTDFRPGTATALVGPNGSGKTTLLEVLAGLRTPTTGLISGERPSVALGAQRHVRTWMPLTVGEVILMARFRPTFLPRRLEPSDHATVDTAAGRLGVRALLDSPLDRLSLGQRQRVLVAQALAREADLLLLDEPITGLDLISQERILSVIAQERAAGRIVVLSTHHLDEARHCDQVLVLDGRLVAAGTPNEVLTPDVLRQAYGERVLDDPARGLVLVDDHGHGHEYA
ncbi:MAG: metal ABC transporter ATP-binding protein [Actinomycetota bacterium]|nr:metal ABC transporter ATP-binding protein [Actinomycetota bacterium]